jgi:hypothetical protein
MDTERAITIASPDGNSDTRGVKDPCVVRLPSGEYMMYASLPPSSWDGWGVGRFTATHPGGPWTELGPAKIYGIEGAEVCAPSVVVEEKDGAPLYKMYVQTTCFSEEGVIALAVSRDGENFYPGNPTVVMSADDVKDAPHKVVGLYDVALSDVTRQGKTYECMTFSGYRRLGCGDIFMSMREKNGKDDAWSPPKPVLLQENVPVHNKPGSSDFEWGLEGAKIVQLAEDVYVMVGVCFLSGADLPRGTRQRVFMAAASAPDGPFHFMKLAIAPAFQAGGENGHPDTLDLGNGRLGILYQERRGDAPEDLWHLRYGEVEKSQLLTEAKACLAAVPGHTSVGPQTPRPFPKI